MSQSQPPQTPPATPPQQNVQPTTVVLVTGKKANQNYRKATLRRENAVLSDTPNAWTDPRPPTIAEDEQKENAER